MSQLGGLRRLASAGVNELSGFRHQFKHECLADSFGFNLNPSTNITMNPRDGILPARLFRKKLIGLQNSFKLKRGCRINSDAPFFCEIISIQTKTENGVDGYKSKRGKTKKSDWCGRIYQLTDSDTATALSNTACYRQPTLTSTPANDSFALFGSLSSVPRVFS